MGDEMSMVQYGATNDTWAVPQYDQAGAQAGRYGGQGGGTQPYGANMPAGMNPPYGANTPAGMNPPYGTNMPVGMNQPYGANTPVGMTQPYGANIPVPYAMNYPAETPQMSGFYPPNLPPAVFPYTFEENPYARSQEAKEESVKAGILIGTAGLILLSVFAILLGLLVNDKSEKISIEAIGRALAAGGREEEEEADVDPEKPLVDGSFPTQGAGTARGALAAEDHNGAVYLITDYGVCRVLQNGSVYEADDWAVVLEPGVRVRSLAVCGNYLYMACGSDGIMRAQLTDHANVEKVTDADVTSFVVAGDRIIYISMDGEYGGSGELCAVGTDGRNARTLQERVICGNVDNGNVYLEYAGGYLYYLDSGSNLCRMYADGTGKKLLAEQSGVSGKFTGCGLYYNNDVIYLPSEEDGIYAYDIATDTVQKITCADVYCQAPVVFAGDALLYRNRGIWRQILDGEDTVYDSELNDGTLCLQGSIGGGLLGLHSYDKYYYVTYRYGNIRSENMIEVDYYTAPETREPLTLRDYAQENGAAGAQACRLVYFGGDYTIYNISGGADGSGNGLVYTDGEHTYMLSERETEYFAVIGGEVYFTRTDGGGGYYLWKRGLEQDAEPEQIVSGRCGGDLFCCDGVIYYADLEEEGIDYYDLSSGESGAVTDDPAGCWYLLDHAIYYEGRNDGNLYKIGLDGSGKETLSALWEDDVDPSVCYLECLTAFEYDGEVYLAFTSSEGSLELMSEDGSFRYGFAETYSTYDLRQDIYYADGALYYSQNNAFEVHRLDLQALFSEGGEWEPSDTLICQENFMLFEVIGGRICVQLFLEDEIKVFDYQTGEQYESFSGAGF